MQAIENGLLSPEIWDDGNDSDEEEEDSEDAVAPEDVVSSSFCIPAPAHCVQMLSHACKTYMYMYVCMPCSLCSLCSMLCRILT